MNITGHTYIPTYTFGVSTREHSDTPDVIMTELFLRSPRSCPKGTGHYKGSLSKSQFAETMWRHSLRMPPGKKTKKTLACAGADTGFSERGGGWWPQGVGGDRGWSPLSAKNYCLNTHNFQLQGGGGVITPTTTPPPPVSATACVFKVANVLGTWQTYRRLLLIYRYTNVRYYYED